VHTTILTNGNNQLVPVHYIKTTQYTLATHKIDFDRHEQQKLQFNLTLLVSSRTEGKLNKTAAKL